jgi:hypothetical protein
LVYRFGTAGKSPKIYRGAVPFSVGGYLVDHPLADRPIFGFQELALRCSHHFDASNKGSYYVFRRDTHAWSQTMDRKGIQVEKCHSFEGAEVAKRARQVVGLRECVRLCHRQSFRPRDGNRIAAVD